MKHIPPSLGGRSFSCPYCQAHSVQFWFSLAARPLDKEKPPVALEPPDLAGMSWNHIEVEEREKYKKFVNQLVDEDPFIGIDDAYSLREVCNLFLSKCFSCGRYAVWRKRELLWPNQNEAPNPNPDLPEDVRRDYEEAGRVVAVSPRGAAALLRLCIQKLCTHLGERGKNIDNDIAALVKKGLDVRIQQALDVVRVVGNNAVHPGTMDLRDDRATAEKLFGLVNLVADVMISQPKHIAEMYGSLPAGAVEAIARRDKQT